MIAPVPPSHRCGRIPFFLGVIFPVLFVIAEIGTEHSMSLDQREWLLSENGPHEFAQFFVLLGAAIVAAATLWRMEWARDRLLTAWVSLALGCSIYVGGEEISWGQHLFFWETPEHWAQVNDQNETNLHNTSAWLDQKPRLILEIGIIVGGIVLPLYRWLRPGRLPPRFDLFYPTDTLVPLAIVATLTKQSQSVMDWAHGPHIFHRVSEVQELLFFVFVLAYLMILKERIAARDSGG